MRSTRPSASALGAFGVDAIVGPEHRPRRVARRPRRRWERAAGRQRRRERRSRRPARARDSDAEGSDARGRREQGSPGASECAASLAALAEERWPTALVECDLLGGGLDLRLAADGHAGSLLGLVRACAAGDGALGELLERWLVRRPGWPPVLLAPPDPYEPLGELAQPGAIAGALRALAAAVPLVVCDVGFLLDEGGDATPVARCHREALACASAVLLVIGARERQLRDGLAQLDLLRDELEIPNERLRVACTGLGAPGTGSHRTRDRDARRAARRARARPRRSLPFDGRALRRAERRAAPARRCPPARRLRPGASRPARPALPARPRSRKPVSASCCCRCRRRSSPANEEVTLPWRTS